MHQLARCSLFSLLFTSLTLCLQPSDPLQPLPFSLPLQLPLPFPFPFLFPFLPFLRPFPFTLLSLSWLSSLPLPGQVEHMDERMCYTYE